MGEINPWESHKRPLWVKKKKLSKVTHTELHPVGDWALEKKGILPPD